MGMHLLQRVAQRQQRTLWRPHHIQQLVLVILLLVQQRRMRMQVGRSSGMAQVKRCPRAAHMSGIELVRVGPSVRHQRLPVTTVVREARATN